MRYRPHPGNQFAFVKDRYDALHICSMCITNQGIIVGEYVPFFEANLFLVVVLNHPLYGFTHSVHMHNDTRG